MVEVSFSFSPHSSYAEVKLYLMVLDRQGKAEKRLEVIKGPLGKNEDSLDKTALCFFAFANATCI